MFGLQRIALALAIIVLIVVSSTWRADATHLGVTHSPDGQTYVVDADTFRPAVPADVRSPSSAAVVGR
jgi:hypothetical protein